MHPYLTFVWSVIAPLGEQLVREQERLLTLGDQQKKRQRFATTRTRAQAFILRRLQHAYPQHFVSSSGDQSSNHRELVEHKTRSREGMRISHAVTQKSIASRKSDLRRSHFASAGPTSWEVAIVPETQNFLSGRDDWSMEVSAYRGQEATHTLIFYPHDQTFLHAVNGGGAYLERCRLRLRAQSNSGLCILGGNFFLHADWHQALITKIAGMQHSGSLRTDLRYWLTAQLDGLALCKITASLAKIIRLLARESGGMVIEQGSEDYYDMLVAAPGLLQGLQHELRWVLPPRR